MRRALEQWDEHLRSTKGVSAEQLAREMAEHTSFASSVRKYCPDLMCEIAGIAEGAAVPEQLVFTYNLMDEQWWFLRERDSRVRCTVVAVEPSGGRRSETLLGQNMDLPGFMDGTQVMLRLRAPGQPEALVLSSAGLLSLTGVNHSGIGVCVNALQVLNHADRGLPVTFIIRQLLGCTSLEDGVTLVSAVPHASGQHYLIADSRRAWSFECSANAAVECEPASDGFYVHTNHSHCSKDVDVHELQAEMDDGDIRESTGRLDFVLRARRPLDSVDQLAAVLSDRTQPMCFTPGPDETACTFGSVIFELTVPPTVHARPGLPGTTPWETFGWLA